MFRRLPAALGLLATSLALAWASPPAQEPPKFDHAHHVPAGWSNRADARTRPGSKGEAQRDCRGCHAYEQDRETFKPADRCQRCHDPDRYWERDPETLQKIDASKAKVDPAAEAGGGFQHAHHLVNSATGAAIDCAECHYKPAAPGSKQVWRIVRPSEVEGATDGCITCHAADDAQRRERFNAGLNKDLEQRARRGGPPAPAVFSHAAHLQPAELASGSPESCQRCHTGIASAGADALAQSAYDAQACAQCHTGMRFERSTAHADGRPVTEESPSKLTFSHAQHLGPGKGVAKPIGPKGCLACHAFEPQGAEPGAPRTFELAPFLRSTAGRGAFHGCITCHESWKNDEHGSVDACADCHASDAGARLADGAQAANRPRESVQRVDARSFTFGLQSHVFISAGRTQGAPESCAKCHMAKLAELPSRIEDQEFRHATHLGMNAAASAVQRSDAACRQCHAAVAGSESLKDLATTFDLGACDRCHGRTPPTPTPEERPRTTALRFDHARHVGKRGPDGKTINCVACHEPDRMTLAAGIQDCRTCHSHPPAAGTGINRFTKEMVDSCALCHVAGVPDQGAPVLAARARLLAAPEGYQRHEGTAACDTCHVPGRSDSGASRPPAERPPSTEIAVSTLSRDGKLRNAHRARLKQGALADGRDLSLHEATFFHEQVSCAECHWARLERCGREHVRAAVQHAATPAWVKEILGAPDWHKAAREKLGDKVAGSAEYPEGFPGVVPKR